MKLIDNAPKIMAQMLLDPEKDWSKYLPLVEITNADFDAARGLIQDHINDQSRYEQTLLWLNNYEQQKEQDHRYFLKKLEKELGYGKQGKAREWIRKQMVMRFGIGVRYGDWDYYIFDEFHSAFGYLEDAKRYLDTFKTKIKSLKELDLLEEIREFDPTFPKNVIFENLEGN